MLKDMYTLFSENRTDLRVCLKMKGRIGDRMVGKGRVENAQPQGECGNNIEEITRWRNQTVADKDE